jgi:uncharacterized protein YcbK (DUF882 family)
MMDAPLQSPPTVAVEIERRRFLRASAAAATALLAPPAWAESFPDLRWVKIVFSHTGERYNGVYFADGAYILKAVEKFSYTCRDFRANKVMLLHPWLMDILFVMHWRYQQDEISIFSGYRTAQTNSQLEGAALNSQHIRAMALDVHIPGLDHNLVARDVASFVYGGVGMYPGQQFVHFDFGPLRRWVG